jgi:hypothetical protein
MNLIFKIISSDLTYAIVRIAKAIPALRLKLLRQPLFPFLWNSRLLLSGV